MFSEESKGTVRETAVNRTKPGFDQPVKEFTAEQISVSQMNTRFEATSTGSHSSMASGKVSAMLKISRFFSKIFSKRSASEQDS